MIPLSAPYLNGREYQYLKECVDTNWVSSSGSFVKKFEEEVCRHTGAKYAVGCINGTAGLHIALLLAGVVPEDEVIVPTLTFIAPVNAVKYTGAEPVFVDCDDYMNMDSEKLSNFCRKECVMTTSGLKNKKSGRIVRAVIPVHIFGNPCDMPEIMRISKEYNLKVIEDASESLGSYYSGGKFTGTIGDIGVFSFNGNKIITSGAGGMLVTRSNEIAKKAGYLTTQAKDDPARYIHNRIGYNYRMSNLHAAVGLAQLEQLDKFISVKKRNYGIYSSQISRVKGVSLVKAPPGTFPNFWFYSLVVEKNEYGAGRDGLLDILKENKIESRPLWQLNHLQRPYKSNQAYRIEKALWFSGRVLNLPCSVNLNETDIKQIVSVIKDFSQGGSNGKAE